MKSAYELAMERLQQADPDAATPLTEEQKQALAEADQKFKARIAEREIFLKGKILEARRARDGEALRQLEEQLRNEKARLEDERESAKEKIRRG